MDFTGRGIFTVASSWAWAHGPAGAMATAGVSIASATAAAEAIAAAAAPWPIAAVLRAAAGAEQHVAVGLFAPAAARFVAMQGLTILAERVPAQAALQRLAPAAVVDRTRRQHIAAVVVVMPAAVVVVMPAVVVVVMPAAAAVVMLVAAAAVADTGNLNAAA